LLQALAAFSQMIYAHLKLIASQGFCYKLLAMPISQMIYAHLKLICAFSKMHVQFYFLVFVFLNFVWIVGEYIPPLQELRGLRLGEREELLHRLIYCIIHKTMLIKHLNNIMCNT
jgi:hypothetical protein